MKKATKFKGLGDDTLKCRVWVHAWDHKTTYVGKRGRTETIELHLECLRCNTLRIDEYGRKSFELLSRKYDYTPGYLVGDLKSWGGRKTFNNNVREELIGRIVSKKAVHAVRAG